jgi:hypothetical protein
MSLRKGSAIGVGRATIAMMAVMGALTAGSPARAQGTPGENEQKAAQKAQAVERVVQNLKEKAVRPAPEARFLEDARRIVGGMRPEQIEALAGGEALQKVMASTPVEAPPASTDPAPPVATAAAAPSPGDPASDLLYVPITPCRVIDTRLAGGKVNAGEVRDYRIAGTAGFDAQGGKSGGCGIPIGASTPLAAAVMLNFVAVQPEGSGDLRSWPFGDTVPLAAVLTYDNLGPFFSISNGIVVPITGISSVAADLSVRADFNRTHLVVDVTGYFTRFPVENFQGGLKSTVLSHDFTTLIDLSDGACKEFNTCTVTAATSGTVIVEGWGQFVADHSGGTLDRVVMGVETAATVACDNVAGTANAATYDVPAALGTNPDFDFTISHGRAFSQAAGTTQTYRLSGKMASGASSGDAIENSRMICTFIPD